MRNVVGDYQAVFRHSTSKPRYSDFDTSASYNVGTNEKLIPLEFNNPPCIKQSVNALTRDVRQMKR